MKREPRHGTTTGYFSDGCRCEECRQAARVYQRDLRARKRGEDPVARPKDFDSGGYGLRDLLRELFPEGLTDDCPARRGRVKASAG